jgi:hypothetical protein
MIEFLKEVLIFFEGAEELLYMIIAAFGGGGGWLGRIIYKLKNSRDDLTKVINKVAFKNETFLEIARAEGLKHAAEELQKLIEGERK